jgi:hypothetical protein
MAKILNNTNTEKNSLQISIWDYKTMKIIWVRPKNGPKKCWSGYHGEAERKEDRELDGQKEYRMQSQRTGWIQNNDDYKSTDVHAIKKPIHTYI